MRVIVHGGAGSQPARRQTESDGRARSSPDDLPKRQAALDEAAEAGAAEPMVTDAVCAAVQVLESDLRFNAGVGSVAQSDGVVRTDAGLMTDDREAGAACGMPGVKRAVDVARIVKEETPHILIAGVHAVDLAEAFGVETGVDLWTEDRRADWEDLTDVPPVDDKRAQLAWLRGRFGGADGAGATGGRGDPESHNSAGQRSDGNTTESYDTVGAVARDGDRLAAATSTGGRWLALAGRVGDVPQIGAGFYCSRAGGASATGAGEDIARVTLARRAVDHLEHSRNADAAARLAIEEFADLTGSKAGVIVMGNDGETGEAYNSEAMGTSVTGD